MFQPWVTEPVFTSVTLLIPDTLVVTVMGLPHVAVVGAAVMLGRVASVPDVSCLYR